MKNRNYVFYLLFGFLGLITEVGRVHAQTSICSKTDLPVNLQNGLVAFYPFCGNANDASGNGNNGTVNGATLTTDRFGTPNSAYYFSSQGCATYIQANVNTSSIQTGQTISVWISKSGNGCIAPRLFEFWPGNDGPGKSQWGWANESEIYIGSITSTNQTAEAIIPRSPNNTWIHLVYTNDGQTAKFYKNGELINTVLSMGNPILAENLAIGRMNHPAWDAFNGKIDDLMVFNRALSSCEVNQLFNSSSTFLPVLENITISSLSDTTYGCGKSTILDAGPGYKTYKWSTGETTQIINATTTGWHKVTVKNASGCSASDSTYVSLLKANIINKDTTICKQSLVQLYMDTIALKPLDSLIRPGDIWEYTLNTPTGNWKNEFGTWTKGNAPFGNTSFANDFKAVTYWPANKTLYVRKSIDLTNFDLSSLKWYLGVDNGYKLYVNGVLLSQTYADGYTIRWEYFGQILQSLLYTGINYIALELTDGGGATAFDFMLSGKQIRSNTKYRWSTGETSANISVKPAQTTKYKVEVTDGISTCTDSINITVDNLSKYNSLQDTLSICGTSVFLDANSGYKSYLWNTSATTQSINVKTSGWHKVTVKNANECSASDSTFVSLVNARIIQKDTTVCSSQNIKISLDSTLFVSDTTLVDQFTMTFMSAFSRTVNTVIGKKYFMKVSGTFDYNCDYSGGKHDAAWKFYPTLTKSDHIFSKWNNLQIRPKPDVYNPSHVYNYDLGIATQSTQNFIFTDNPYGDNCGSLKFSIYEVSQGLKTKVKWSTGDSTYSISVKPNKTTTYKVEVTDGITICKDSITISVAPVDTAIVVTGSTTFCSGDSVQLKAASNSSYQWYKNGVIIAGVNTDTYFAKTSGDYYARVTSVQTCIDSTRKISVVANPLPTGNLQLPSIPTICDTIPVILNVTGGATYQWYLNGSKISNVSTSSHRAYITGTYKVEMISDKGCKKMAADSVVLNKLLTPTLDITNDLRCINSTINFSNAGNVASSGFLSYAWNFGDGTTSVLQSPQKIYNRHGDFTIDLSIKSQTCPSFDRSVSKTITIKEPTLGIRYADMNVVSNTSVPLTTRQIGLTYSWQPVSGLNNPSISNPILKTTTPQDYKIVIKDSAGCTTVDSIRVLIFIENNIIVPKAFSPNGDGANDYLFPNLIGIKELKSFRIYNRWGILMYRSSIQMPGWDGNYQDKKQPMETYTWIADGIDINGKYIIRSGNTLLMR